MIRPQLQTAPAAPATLVSLARVGIAGLSMASLLDADDVVCAAPLAALGAVAPRLGTDVTTDATAGLAAPRVRAAV